MHRHQGNLIVGIFVIAHVNGTQKRDILQESAKSLDREIRLRNLRSIGYRTLGHKLLHELVMLILDIALDTVDEFLYVRSPGLALDRIILLEETVESGSVGKLRSYFVGILAGAAFIESCDHVAELADLDYRGIPEPIGLQNLILQICSFQQRTAGGLRGLGKRLDRSVADPSGRRIYDPAERLVVIDVDDQFEIGHHVLDLGPVEEGVAGVYYVREIPLAEGLLESAGLGVGAVEYREILVLAVALLHRGDDRRSYEHSLLLFGVGLDQPYLVARVPFGKAVLRDTALIPGNQGVGRLNDGLR